MPAFHGQNSFSNNLYFSVIILCKNSVFSKLFLRQTGSFCQCITFVFESLIYSARLRLDWVELRTLWEFQPFLSIWYIFIPKTVFQNMSLGALHLAQKRNIAMGALEISKRIHFDSKIGNKNDSFIDFLWSKFTRKLSFTEIWIINRPIERKNQKRPNEPSYHHVWTCANILLRRDGLKLINGLSRKSQQEVFSPRSECRH